MTNVPAPHVTIALSPKSVGIAILLTVLFGPLGMFYSTVSGAVIMIVLAIIIMVVTFGVGLLLVWPVSIIWGAMAASAYNKNLMSGARQP